MPWFQSIQNKSTTMKKTKIYRIEVWGSDDSCTEYWGSYPISDFYIDKEKAERKLKRLKKLTKKQLKDLADVVSVGTEKPYIEEYDLID